MPEGLVTDLLNVGVTGILVLLLIRGELVPKGTHEREIKRGDLATENSVKTSEALRSVTEALTRAFDRVSLLIEEVKALRAEVAALKTEIANLRGSR